MEHDAYAPPVAAVAEIPAAGDATSYYVVGRTKFLLLYVLTFGAYQVVWMYQHWANFKRTRKVPMWPVARAIFPVFFFHSLTEDIDYSLTRAQLRHAWSPKGLATTLVVLNIATTFIGRIGDKFMDADTTTLILIACVAPMTWSTWQVQRAANIACGQPEGATNRRLTLANWFWMLLGALVWALMIVGLSMGEAATNA